MNNRKSDIPEVQQIPQFMKIMDDLSVGNNPYLVGSAGTGKTSTISTLVNTLWKAGKKAVLLAPTGRAAKVISLYSKKQAFTVESIWRI